MTTAEKMMTVATSYRVMTTAKKKTLEYEPGAAWLNEKETRQLKSFSPAEC